MTRQPLTTGRVVRGEIIHHQTRRPPVPTFDRALAESRLDTFDEYRDWLTGEHVPADVPAGMAEELAESLSAALAEIDRLTAAVKTAGSKTLHEAAEAWAADPDSVGDSDKDARNWLRERADR